MVQFSEGRGISEICLGGLWACILRRTAYVWFYEMTDVGITWFRKVI